MKIRKRVFILFLCAFILLPSLAPILSYVLPMIVHAEEYKKNDEDKDSGITYYIVEGKDVDKLFDFTLGDLLGGDAVNWVFSFKTYTVIGKTDKDYHMYFNTPNLQSIVKNNITKIIDDGYTDDTYDVNETEWIVDVGKKTKGSEISYDNENVISKYGFAIPSYTYMGEYPKVTMSTAGIVPSSF